MDKSIFTSVRTALLEVSDTVMIWHNDILSGVDTLATYPALFLEFSNLQFADLPYMTQECTTAQVTVHVIWKAIESNDTEIFDISQDVYKAMKQAGYNRKSETPVYTASEVIDWQMVYEIPTFIDESAKKIYTNYPKPPIEITE